VNSYIVGVASSGTILLGSMLKSVLAAMPQHSTENNSPCFQSLCIMALQPQFAHMSAITIKLPFVKTFNQTHAVPNLWSVTLEMVL
jgi:hypothetical protein